MRILCLMYGLTPREWFCLMGRFLARGMSATLLMVLLGSVAMPRVFRWCWSARGE